MRAVGGKPVDGVSECAFPNFAVKNNLFDQVVKVGDKMVVPKFYISKVLYLAHSHLLGAHLGVEKTYDRFLAWFYWPGVKRAVQDYCRQCAKCKKTAPKCNLPKSLYQ